eukprot:TRINITY_DN155_c0_g3_i1.p1 TRINITY_DN155_c0_g3~~TRINITY_DN155_c0_g3_i1.p1  ORF type:complete len:711 (-),score=224.73 TRINITY_DN155_c0_g3_i1:87-2171(-)
MRRTQPQPPPQPSHPQVQAQIQAQPGPPRPAPPKSSVLPVSSHSTTPNSGHTSHQPSAQPQPIVIPTPSSTLYPFAPVLGQLREVLVPLRLDLSLDQFHISELFLYSLRPPPHSSPSPDLYPLSSTHSNHYSLSVSPSPPHSFSAPQSSQTKTPQTKTSSDPKKSHQKDDKDSEPQISDASLSQNKNEDGDEGETKRVEQYEQEELVVWKIASGLCEDLDLPRQYDPYVAAELLKQIQAFNALYRAAIINSTPNNNPTSTSAAPSSKDVSPTPSTEQSTTAKVSSTLPTQSTTVPSTAFSTKENTDQQQEIEKVKIRDGMDTEEQKTEKPVKTQPSSESEGQTDPQTDPQTQIQSDSDPQSDPLSQTKGTNEGGDTEGVTEEDNEMRDVEGTESGPGESESGKVGLGSDQAVPEKKKRGRKRKYPLPTDPTASIENENQEREKEKEKEREREKEEIPLDSGNERKLRSRTLSSTSTTTASANPTTPLPTPTSIATPPVTTTPIENLQNHTEKKPVILTEQDRELLQQFERDREKEKEKEREREKAIEWIRREVSSSLFPPIGSPISPIPKFEYLVLIKIDITLNHYNLKDQFEWDLFSEINSPERFVKSLCADLGLNKEFEVAIAHSIYEQLMAARLQILHAYSQGNFILHDRESKRSRLTMLREENDLKFWEPRLTYVASTPSRDQLRSKRKN